MGGREGGRPRGKFGCGRSECPRGRFDGCCSECPEGQDCPDACGEAPSDCGAAVFPGGGLELFKDRTAAALRTLIDAVRRKAEAESAEKAVREKLLEAMELHGIKKFDNGEVKLTYVAASTRTTVDGPKLKARRPDVYEEFSRTSAVAPTVRIELAKGGKDGR
jgi:hypothetical protein